MEKENYLTTRTLNHLFMTLFVHNFAIFMVTPAITDVTMSALCPGQDECSLAIYLSGFQQAIVGVGTLIMTPLMGHLSDKYGRKALLTVPMCLTIIPSAILAYNRTRNYFYAYYVLKTLTDMICQGSVHILCLAYVADNVAEGKRASAFGILSGISSCAFVCGNLSTRFLSTATTFQVATTVGIASTVYMRIFLKDSIIADNDLTTPILANGKPETVQANEKMKSTRTINSVPSPKDMFCLLKGSKVITQAVIVTFFGSLGDNGLHASLLFYLKARFHFNKDQFADMMVITGLAGSISLLVLVPLLAPLLGEVKLLSIGLFFAFTHMFLYSIAWAYWVPYVASMFSIFFVFAQPSVRSIVSKQVSSFEQGKSQGCISAVSSVADVISPLLFSPLTALFLSDEAPFPFPGFSLVCVGFASLLAFIQSLMIKDAPPVEDERVTSSDYVDA